MKYQISTYIMPGDKTPSLVVVKEDGSVYEYDLSRTNAEWVEFPPIPGSDREHVLAMREYVKGE